MRESRKSFAILSTITISQASTFVTFGHLLLLGRRTARATMVVSKILLVCRIRTSSLPANTLLRLRAGICDAGALDLACPRFFARIFADATAELPMRLTWINVFVLETKEDILLLRIWLHGWRHLAISAVKNSVRSSIQRLFCLQERSHCSIRFAHHVGKCALFRLALQTCILAHSVASKSAAMHAHPNLGASPRELSKQKSLVCGVSKGRHSSLEGPS